MSSDISIDPGRGESRTDREIRPCGSSSSVYLPPAMLQALGWDRNHPVTICYQNGASRIELRERGCSGECDLLLAKDRKIRGHGGSILIHLPVSALVAAGWTEGTEIEVAMPTGEQRLVLRARGNAGQDGDGE